MHVRFRSLANGSANKGQQHMNRFTARTTVMALDAVWPVGRGLARMLQRSDSIAWAGLAVDTASWREMLIAVRPEIALIDPIGFHISPSELIRLTRGVSPETRVVFFVPTIEEPHVQRWYNCGAAACITKAMEPSLIIDVLHSVHSDIFDRDAFFERASWLSTIA